MRDARAVDVVVAGAGAAGLAAALAAARAGARVRLLDARATPGGTVVHGLIHTLGGLFDADGGPLNPGLPAELVERLRRADDSVAPRRLGRTLTLSVAPATYARVTAAWLAEAGVELWPQATVQGAETASERVEALAVRGPGGELQRLPCAAVVDCTGSAAVVRRVDASKVVDVTPRAAAGLIVQLARVAPGALAFPRGVQVLQGLKRAAAEGRLPAACARAWLDAGTREGEAYLKLAVPEGEEAAVTVWRDALLAHLAHVPGFAAATVQAAGALSARDGESIVGTARLTADDVRAGRRVADAACRGNWPIEYWHPETGVQLEYLPAGAAYDVPRGALQVRGWRNLWAAGRCLSAEPLAQASARVVGTCWATGAAAGASAATDTEHTP